MNSKLNKAAHCYIGYIENNPVCFFAVLHFPHPSAKNIKRGHRLVVLPDYQGLGIGHKFSSEIAESYIANGFRFIITSSTKALYKQRLTDSRWAVTAQGRQLATSRNYGGLNTTKSSNKLSYSYEYLGSKTNVTT